jgi:hypothetical protein
MADVALDAAGSDGAWAYAKALRSRLPTANFVTLFMQSLNRTRLSRGNWMQLVPAR